MNKRRVSAYMGCLVITLVGAGATLLIVHAAQSLADSSIGTSVNLLETPSRTD